jgi:uncharacterized membrane protein
MGMVNNRFGVVWVGAAALWAAGGTAWAQAPRYRIVRVVDTSVEDGYRPLPRALNNAGQAAGFAPAEGLPGSEAIFWNSDGTKQILPVPSDANAAQAFGINIHGAIVGLNMREDGVGERSEPFRAMVWEEGQPRILPFPAGYSFARGLAINDSGDVIGVVRPTVAQIPRLAFWHDGQVEVTGPERVGDSMAINNLRRIVGCGGPADVTAPFQAFVWDFGVTSWLPTAPGNTTSCARALNNRGTIVGNSAGKPVLWQDGAVLTLNPPGATGDAVSINDRGEIIGRVQSSSFYRPAAGGGLFDVVGLIDIQPGQRTYDHGASVDDINDKGEILASMDYDVDGILHHDVVVLAPTPPTGADTQPPVVSITAPGTGSYATDIATLQANATDNAGVAGVQFYFNGQPVGPEDTTAPYSVDVDLLQRSLRFGTNPTFLFYAKARDVNGNYNATNLKAVVSSNHCDDVARGTTLNGWLGTQTGRFTVQWSMATNSISADGGFGLSLGKRTYFSQSSAAVIFAPDGELKVRNGDSYAPTGVRYQFDTFYRFRMVVDVPNNRYSVYYRLPNQAEQPMAVDAHFRGAAVTSLDNWMFRVDEESASYPLTICNVKVR